MKNTTNYTQFKFPFDDILKPGVTLDGRFSRHDTWGLDFLPIDELVKDDVPKFFEEKGLPLKNIYFMYGPAQESLVIHVDGFVEENGTFHGIYCGLNWIYGSTNHVMKWYSSDTVGETSINKEGLRRTRWSISDCVSIEELTISVPTLVRTDIPHNVVNFSNEKRFCVSLRFADITLTYQQVREKLLDYILI